MDDVDLAAETTMYYAPPTPAPDPKPDLRSNAGRAAAGLPPRAPRGSRVPTPTRKGPLKGKPAKTDYTAALTSLMHLTAFGIQFTSPVDSATVMVHSSNVAISLNELAQVKPEFARTLDKLVAAGPYGAVIAALVPLGAQIMVNHKKAAPGMLGTGTPEQIMAAAAALQPDVSLG